MGQGYIPFPGFINTVNSLVDSKNRSDLRLGHIVILAQIAQPGKIHVIHLGAIVSYYRIIVLTILSNDSNITI